ncbi:multidrug effflux MFS transporter [Arthrobacter sp.]|uniref:multidrug effflux MFS transporter n=1 Tax=Arthrobacter sp. TaxID=1667 RepID=UPI00366ABB78
MTVPGTPSRPAELPRRRKLLYVVVLGMLTALGPFTIDLYLPAIPALRDDLDITEAAAQLTLTGAIFGLAAGQLVVGPLSDRVGRRFPLVAAALLHVAASVGASMSDELGVLMVFRVLQGFGAAGGSVVAIAMVRDMFSGLRLVKMMSYVALVNGMAPIFAPVIGSQLLLVMDWQGLFAILAVYGAAAAVAGVLLLAETLPPERRQAAGTSVLTRYAAVLRDRIFVGLLLVGGFNFSALFSYLSASPFVFQDLYGLTEQQYGFLFMVNSLGIVAGVQTSARLVRRFGAQWIIAAATAAQLVFAAAIIVNDQLGLGFWGTAVPLWLFICATGFNFPCIQALALHRHGARAGTAAALLGAATFGFSGAISPVVGLLGVGSATPMASVMAGCIALAIGALWLIVRPRTVPVMD